MGLYSGLCDRCDKPVKALRMSMFNTQYCCQACLAKEKRHPMYAEACRAEQEEIKKGNMDFKGIGRPADL